MDDATKREMETLPDVNWSEIVREAIRGRIETERDLRKPIDRRRALEACRSIDAFRASVSASAFEGTKEIRKWRDRTWHS